MREDRGAAPRSDSIGPDMALAGDAMDFTAPPEERLFEPMRRLGLAARRRFLVILALCLLAHAIPIWLILRWQGTSDLAPGEQEIPVEIVAEPPPEPPPAKSEEKQKPQEKPKLDETIATDAPRAANEEKTDKSAHDKATQAPAVNKNQQPTPAAPDKAESRPEDQAQDPLPSRPDGDPVAAAKPQPAPAQEKPGKDAMASATQRAPDYTFASPSDYRSLYHGDASTTYISTAYGMILSHLRLPASVGAHGSLKITFAIDYSGKLITARLVRSSGSREFDAACLAAVRAASPYPPTPYGTELEMHLNYGGE